ncbi:hypothetical protein D3C87_1112460 [compost metagenome]
MTIVARGFAGDPLAGAVMQRRAAIEGSGHFHAHPWQAARHARDEADVEVARFLFQQAAAYVDAGIAQSLQAAPGHRGVGVFHGGHHAGDARAHQRLRARRRAAEVAAWFQRDVGGGAGGIVAAREGIFHRLDLGVVLARRLGIALPDDLAMLHQHAANARVGRGGEHAPRGEREGQFHGGMVGVGKHGGAGCAVR